MKNMIMQLVDAIYYALCLIGCAIIYNMENPNDCQTDPEEW